MEFALFGLLIYYSSLSIRYRPIDSFYAELNIGVLAMTNSATAIPRNTAAVTAYPSVNNFLILMVALPFVWSRLVSCTLFNVLIIETKHSDLIERMCNSCASYCLTNKAVTLA